MLTILNVFLFAALGALLSAVGFGVAGWQFWAFMTLAAAISGVGVLMGFNA